MADSRFRSYELMSSSMNDDDMNDDPRVRTLSLDAVENERLEQRKTGCTSVILKGLPFSVKDEDIISFLESEVKLEVKPRIHRIYHADGRFSGNCIVDLGSPDDVKSALKKHKKHIGSRYIEVFACSTMDRESSLGGRTGGSFSRSPRRSAPPASNDNPTTKSGNNFVQLRGLPFTVKEDEVRKFLSGCTVLQDGILFGPPDPARKGNTCNGDAFVELATKNDVANAISKHKKNIGSRYIEVFNCSYQDVERYMERQQRKDMNEPRDARPSFSPPIPQRMPPQPMYDIDPRASLEMPRVLPPRIDYEFERREALLQARARERLAEIDRLERANLRAMEFEMRMAASVAPPRPMMLPIMEQQPSSVFTVHMEGFPYDTSREELKEFLYPARPSYVELTKDSDGRVKEATAEFESVRDFEIAMSKHRNLIRTRWVAVKEFQSRSSLMSRREPSFRRERSRSPIRRRAPSPPPTQKPRNSNYRLNLLGIPFDAQESDIEDFFAKVARPLSIKIEKDPGGRSRAAVVAFASHEEMVEAEKMDRQYMKHRYVDIKRI